MTENAVGTLTLPADGRTTPSKGAPLLTAEVFLIPLETRRFLVYAPLRRVAFVANARMVGILADVKDGEYQPAKDPDGAALEFLRRMELVDAGPESPPLTTFAGGPRPTSITLFMTTACNLRCTYCYASAGDTPLRSMSLDLARRGIDFVVANALAQQATEIEVAYHGGGEPTANWQVLIESYDYAQQTASQHGLQLTSAAATNGVLRDDQIDWIVGHLNSVSVSFDGLPEVQDRHRLTISGQGSSERVMHTLRCFDRADFSYGIRVTVTHDNIPRLPESVEFLCTNFRPQRIQVEPAYLLGRWQDAPSAETEAFVNAYREAQHHAALHGREISYSGARLDLLTNHFCGITQDSFALTPDGTVSACYEAFNEENPFADVFHYGRFDRGAGEFRFQLPVLQNLRDQAVQHRAFCQGCFAKWHCAGDCYHKSLTVNGRGEFAGSDRCHITRELTKDQILARIAAAGGLFWHEPPPEDPVPAARGKELLR